MNFIPADAPLERHMPAHVEDSTALAEHLLPKDLQTRLELMGATPSTPYGLYLQACLFNEYSLATPGYEGDDKLFARSRDNLLQIITSDLPPRDQLRLKAEMLFAWQIPFDLRAHSLPIPPSVSRELQKELGEMQLRFLDEGELTSTENGQLAELVAASYLLNTEHFPYVATMREEANMLRSDNHDFYTLHQCRTNCIKKAPLSIKYRQETAFPDEKVILLTIGKLALAEALSTPPYSEDPLFRNGERRAAKALRLAADIMICHTAGEALSPEDNAFMWGLTARLVYPIEKYVESEATPDYESNAAAIQAEITARERRLLERT